MKIDLRSDMVRALHEILNPDPVKVEMWRAFTSAHEATGLDRFNHWRKAYQIAEQFIREMPLHRWFCDPYSIVRDGRFFTPIEREFWSVIRIVGIVLYPQYPVGRYFVDFGHPVARVAVECDGVQWHDPVKDMARDAELKTMGWKVFRLQGKDIFREWYPVHRNSPYEDEDDSSYLYDEDGDRRPMWSTGEYDPATSLAIYLDAKYGIGYGTH